MPGFATFESQPAPLDSDAVPTVVFRLAEGAYQILPNVRCLSVSTRIGADAGEARFRYVFDPGGVFGSPAWPSTPEDALDPTASGPYVVKTDDRVVVFGYTAEGDRRILFDGFALIAAGMIGSRESTVEFVARATPVRCRDEPIWKSFQRDADAVEDPDASKYSYIPAVFNPGGKANATGEGFDATQPPANPAANPAAVVPSGPVFLDPATCKARGIGRLWSVAMAARHILAFYNDEAYVDSGNLSAHDAILDGVEPDPPDGFIDLEDESTYTTNPVIIREYDATGAEWPDALEKILTPYGFNFAFALTLGDDDLPSWTVRVFRVADYDSLSSKSVYLQPEGDYLDPALTNVLEFRLARDVNKVQNDVTIQSAPNRCECSLVLAPGFPIQGGDAQFPQQFDLTDDAALAVGSEDDRDLDSYRLYVFDEAGDYHWDFGADAAVLGKATGLAKVIGPDPTDEDSYVHRLRPARAHILTKDAAGEPRQALLLLSWDYDGPSPGVWDGSGTWFEAGGAWSLCDDRIGIRLTAKSAESWQTGNKAIASPPSNDPALPTSSGGLVKGVSMQSVPRASHFTLMLVTVIEGDDILSAHAARRAASPTKFVVKNYVDAVDRYRFDVVKAGSWWNRNPAGGDASDKVVRDDTKDAQFDASQRRAALEMPPLTGSITIGRLVNAYDLADRITDVSGRGLSLRTNVKAEGEGPTYPMVVGIDYDLDGGQRTVLHLHDQRGDNGPKGLG